MYKGVWRRSCALLACGVTALTLAGQSAPAQETELDLLRQRVQRLEEQNQRLQEAHAAPTYPTATVDQHAIENIVQDYMNKQALPPGPASGPGDDGWHAVGSDLGLRAFWNHGLFLSACNNDFILHLRGRLFYDGGLFTQNSPGLPQLDDAQALRSARIGLEGQIWELFRFRADIDFADPDGLHGDNFGGPTSTRFPGVIPNDVFVEVNKLPYLGNFRAGYFKEPFGLEQQTSLSFTTFMERSLIDMGRPTANTAPLNGNEVNARGLVPGRNTGMMLYNNWFDGRVYGAVGWFRTQSGLTGFDAGDGEYSYTARLTGLPYWQHNGRGLIHVGIAGSYRDYNPQPTGSAAVAGVVNANVPRYQARPITIGTPALLDTGNITNVDNVNLYGAELAAVAGPLSFQSEVVGATLNRTAGGNVNYWGYYAYVSYFLTGEHRRYNKNIASFDRVIPVENFFCVSGSEYETHGRGFCCGAGAWEIAARYSMVNLGNSNFATLPGVGLPTGVTNAGGTGTLEEFTLGLNWYWNPNMRWMMNYIHARRDSVNVLNDGDADLLAWRFQVDW